jgi:hypothetical protein
LSEGNAWVGCLTTIIGRRRYFTGCHCLNATADASIVMRLEISHRSANGMVRCLFRRRSLNSKPKRRWAKERIFSAGLVFYTLREGPRRVLRPQSLSLCFRLFKVRKSLQKPLSGNNYNMMAMPGWDNNQQREVRFSALSRRHALGGALRMAPLGYAGVPLLHSAFNTLPFGAITVAS